MVDAACRVAPRAGWRRVPGGAACRVAVIGGRAAVGAWGGGWGSRQETSA